MATYRVTVTVLDPYNSRAHLLTQDVELGTPPGWSDKAIAIEVLKLVDGAECPYDCDTCRED